MYDDFFCVCHNWTVTNSQLSGTAQWGHVNGTVYLGFFCSFGNHSFFFLHQTEHCFCQFHLLVQVHFLLVLFFFFGGTEVWTLGFTLARQVFYHLSPSASLPSPFLTSPFLLLYLPSFCYNNLVPPLIEIAGPTGSSLFETFVSWTHLCPVCTL
jgi:hypothetical protein